METPLSDDDRDILAGISVMMLAIANRQNLADQAHMQDEDELEGMEPAPCSSPSKDESARYCIREVGHSGRHKHRPSSGLVIQTAPRAGGRTRTISPERVGPGSCTDLRQLACSTGLLGMGGTMRMADRGRADVLMAAAAGDEVAFRRIIAAYHDDMRRVCRAISGDQTIADEATQAAWLIAWKKMGKVHGEDRLRPWLVSVAANEAKKLMGKRRRRAEFETIFESSGEPRGIDPATGIAHIDLDAAMARLDPDDRALLAMRYVAGFDSNELARATGISPSGTRSRIERLLKRLREDLE